MSPAEPSPAARVLLAALPGYVLAFFVVPLALYLAGLDGATPIGWVLEGLACLGAVLFATLRTAATPNAPGVGLRLLLCPFPTGPARPLAALAIGLAVDAVILLETGIVEGPPGHCTRHGRSCRWSACSNSRRQKS